MRHSPDGCECKKEIQTSDVSLSSACLVPVLPQVLIELSSVPTLATFHAVFLGESGSRVLS